MHRSGIRGNDLGLRRGVHHHPAILSPPFPPPRTVCHRRAPLNERRELLLAEPLASVRQRMSGRNSSRCQKLSSPQKHLELIGVLQPAARKQPSSRRASVGGLQRAAAIARRPSIPVGRDPKTVRREQGPRHRRALNLSPPDRALVLCVDENEPDPGAGLAASRSCRVLPGMPKRCTHDYKRPGTTSLFAALR